MDITKQSAKITQFLKKYRYAFLILVIGLALMLIPDRAEQNQNETQEQSSHQETNFEDISGSLKQILSQIDGVGQVEVMLTVTTGEQNIYQVDEDTSSNDAGSTIRKETVIISGTDRQEQALISYIRAPVYKGAIIVCKGADNPTVKLAIIDAVSKITGLTSDKISVLKMK